MTTSIDERIARIAASQHGVVTRAQLLGAGLSPDMVDGRVRSRRLRVLHRGVYLHGALVGPLVPVRAREMAAVLACGAGAVVSHESAASLWELLPRRDGEPVHITIPGADRGRRPGIRPHRVASLPAEAVASIAGIPVTAPARTLVDLAGRVRPRALEQALAGAERRELIDPGELAVRLAAPLERRPRRGLRVLRALLEARHRPALTRSAAEERLLALIRSGGLPAPEVNAMVDGYEADFFWRARRVAVEVDGFAYHSSRRTFENDRRRDARLAAQGILVVRVTWRQIAGEPDAVLVRLAQTLARAEPRDPLRMRPKTRRPSAIPGRSRPGPPSTRGS